MMERGELVPDALVGELITERMSQRDVERGFILDGYPRTVAQAEALDRILAGRGMELDAVLEIAVDEAALLDRILKRVGEAKRRSEPVRADDHPEVFKRRLANYRAQSAPLIAHYRALGKLRTVDGGRPINNVTQQLLTAIGANGYRQ
jgi:adenylate kinase